MKRVLLLLLMTLNFTLLKAQEVQAGPQFGVNYTTNDHGVSGIKMGGIIDMGISEWLSLRSGLLYSQKGKNFGEERLIYKTDYLTLPVTPQVTFGGPLQFIFRAGGYAGFKVSPKVITSTIGILG